MRYIIRFENDVELYGTQTLFFSYPVRWVFENDVELYGTQTKKFEFTGETKFENDVELYGTQTILDASYVGM